MCNRKQIVYKYILWNNPSLYLLIKRFNEHIALKFNTLEIYSIYLNNFLV